MIPCSDSNPEPRDTALCTAGPPARKSSAGLLTLDLGPAPPPTCYPTSRPQGHAVLKPLVSLDTPGKASVAVVIVADPDGYEICFVEDEGFRALSKVDPAAAAALEAAISEDRSKEWMEGGGGLWGLDPN